MRVQRTARRASGTRLLATAAGLAALAIGLGPVIQASAAPTPPSPAVGHASVIAQGVIAFDGSPQHWSIAHHDLAPAAAPAPVAAIAPFFLLAGAGAAVAADGESLTRLAAGEGLLVRDEEDLTVQPSGAAPAGLFSIALVAGAPNGATSVGDPFSPGAGNRDVDLIRDVVAAGETAIIPDAAAAPILLLVVEGAVNVATAASPEATAMGAGEARTLEGELTITNAGDAPAEVVAAVIGPLVELVAPTTTTTTTSTTTTAPPTTTTTTSTSTTTTTSTTSTTTTTLDLTDSDGDGLIDVDEAGFGSDPNNQDTDGDAIDDGDEVHLYGTSPISDDTDVDGIGDYAEIDVYGTIPNLFDSDGDEIGDGAEVFGNFTDPLDDDTDDDGLDDGEEGLLGTDPLAVDTDGDGVDDGTEVAAGTDPLDPLSF